MDSFRITEQIEFPKEMEENIQNKSLLFLKLWYSEATGSIKNEIKTDNMKHLIVSEFKSAFVDTIVNIKLSNAVSNPHYDIPSSMKISLTSIIFFRWAKLFNLSLNINRSAINEFRNILSSYFNNDMLTEFYKLNIHKFKINETSSEKKNIAGNFINKLKRLRRRLQLSISYFKISKQ